MLGWSSSLIEAQGFVRILGVLTMGNTAAARGAMVGNEGVVGRTQHIAYYLGAVPCTRLSGDKHGCVSVMILDRTTLEPKRVQIIEDRLIADEPMTMYNLLRTKSAVLA